MSIFKKTSLLVRLLLNLTKFQKGLSFHFFFRSEASLSMYAHRAVLQCVFTELFTRWCFSQMVVLLLLRGLYKDLSFLHKAISSLVIQGAHRRTGRGASGNAAPPRKKSWATQIFLVSKRKFRQSQFLRSDVSMFFFFIIVLKRYIFSILT